MVCKGEIIYMDKTSSIPKHIKAALSLHDNSLKNIYMQNNNLIMVFDPTYALCIIQNVVFINAKILNCDGIQLGRVPDNAYIVCIDSEIKRLSDILYETTMEFHISYTDNLKESRYKYITIQMENVQYTTPDNLGICSKCGRFITDFSKNDYYKNKKPGHKVNGVWQCLECPKLIKPNRQNIEHFNLIKPKDK